MLPKRLTAHPDRVGLGDAIIIGLASSGPAQTLAVSLAALIAVSGYGGVVPILICFVPMIGIAIAYQRLNRWDQSSGATYSWVAKVFHPYLGFLSGWMILLYYTLGTTTLTIPAGVYTIDLLAPSFIDNHWAIFLVGATWNLLITALAVMGLKIVARFEWVIVLFQYAALLTVAAVALMALLHGTTAARFSWAWFSWTGLGGMKGLMGGILIACFMYSGWDASIYVNEETTDRANVPGKAALASVAMLALVYSLVTFAFQSVLTPEEIASARRQCPVRGKRPADASAMGFSHGAGRTHGYARHAASRGRVRGAGRTCHVSRPRHAAIFSASECR